MRENAKRFWWVPLMTLLLRVWATTWRVRVRGQAPAGPAIVAFWHGNLAALAPLHADRNWVGLVSQSHDGDLLAAVLGAMGFGLVRGSSSRGGVGALVGLREALLRGAVVAIAVDGPRGPRGQVAPGAVALAAMAACPLVAVRLRASPSLRLGSWDGSHIPFPFGRLELEYVPWGGGDLGELLGSPPIGPQRPQRTRTRN